MNDDWRFRRTKLDPVYSGLDRPYQTTVAGKQVTGSSRVESPSGTNWNATFGRNQLSSPSGTNWTNTFNYNGSRSPSGTDWAKTFGSPFLAPKSTPQSTFNFTLGGDLSNQLKLGSTTTNGANRIASAGEELDLPNDPFRKFFGGGIPTPTPTPSPSPTSKYMASSPVIPPTYQVPKMDREEQLYGWGSGYA